MKPKIYLLLLITCCGCSVARRLPTGEKLFAGSRFELRPDSTISKGELTDIQASLTTLARPKPNARLLGWPYKVWLYYFFGQNRKETGILGSLRKRFGEPPVLASAKALVSNSAVFVNQLENEGYFRSTSEGRYEEKGADATAVYAVQVRPRYRIDSVAFLVDSSLVRTALFNTSPRSVLKAGDPYRFETIKSEQARIAASLKQRGFFYFQPSYVAILADSAVGRYGVKLYVAIKPDMPAAAGLTYRIRNVYIYPNYTLNNAARDTSQQQEYTRFKQFNIADSTRIYDPRLFETVISLRPGQRYNSRQQDLSLSRLINLGAFKFVRNQFRPDFVGDSAVLDVQYFLTPSPRKSIRVEVAGTSKSNSLAGALATLSWRNRNLFRRAELLTVNLNGGIESQIGLDTLGTTSYRYGVDANISFPRLLVPFFTIRYDKRQLLPKTILSLGYEVIVRSQLYNLNAASASLSYSWKPNQQSEQTLSPVVVNFVTTTNLGPQFFERLLDPATTSQYSRLLEDQFIIATGYSINYGSSPRTTSPSTYRLTFTAESAGNLAGVFLRPNSVGYKTIFDVPFAQYVRTDLDLRQYNRVSPGLIWANRLFVGLGVPYGNSSVLPLSKQYFVGGSSSLRGFRPRTLGPGRFSVLNTPINERVYFQDGGGDIKIEANTELRPRFNKYLQGALFIDAGNIWTYSDEATYPNSGSRFNTGFLTDLAVSGGFGLRIDLSYFVIRADLATPLRKPYLPEGPRWVLDRIDLQSRAWRQDNLILNIAVGFPF
jgi:outer membrane protein insertion porin family